MVRFGVIGTNWITHKFLKGGMKVEGFSLNAVYSRTKEKAEAFAKEYGIGHIFTDLEEMAKCDEIDAVYIASPNSLHAWQSILFLKNGKHVLCEKPLASNTKEVQEMVDAARKHDVLLMEAMKNSFYPNFQSIKENLHKIGVIRRVVTSKNRISSQYYSFKNGELPNTFNPELSNGSLMDIGVYCIYPVVSLFGVPKRIIASGYILQSGVDGGGSVLMEYDDMEAIVMHSKTTNSSLPSEIVGEKGSILIDSISSPTNVEIVYIDGTKENITREQDPDPFRYEVEEFIKLIQTEQKESSINTYELSIKVMEILTEIRNQIGVRYPADDFLRHLSEAKK